MNDLAKRLVEAFNGEVKQTILVPHVHYEHQCPYCNKIIQEKSTYSDDNGITMRHNLCKGAIEFTKE